MSPKGAGRRPWRKKQSLSRVRPTCYLPCSFSPHAPVLPPPCLLLLLVFCLFHSFSSPSFLYTARGLAKQKKAWLLSVASLLLQTPDCKAQRIGVRAKGHRNDVEDCLTMGSTRKSTEKSGELEIITNQLCYR
jgi:hypothetical protein